MATMRSRTCERPRRPPLGVCWGQWGFLAGMAALALLATSCATEPPETADPRPAPTSPAAEPAGPPVPPEEDPVEADPDTAPVPRELRFVAPKLGGGQVRGAEYAGRDVAIWFWAPW